MEMIRAEVTMEKVNKLRDVVRMEHFDSQASAHPRTANNRMCEFVSADVCAVM